MREIADQPNTCLICGKDLRQHSWDEILACANNPQGKPITNVSSAEWTGATFKGQESDPVQRAQSLEEINNAMCACGKIYREHSREDHKACSARRLDEVMLRMILTQGQTLNAVCRCGKTVRDHSRAGIRECAVKYSR